MARKKSKAWRYFDEKTNGIAICRICRESVKTSSNTSNAWKHLAKHGIQKDNGASAVVSTSSASASNGNANRLEIDSDSDEPQPISSTIHEDSTPRPETMPEAAQRPSPSFPSLSALLGKRKSENVSGFGAPLKQPTLLESRQRSESYKESGTRAAELDDAFLYMVMRDNMPLRTGDKEGFNLFAKAAVPLWTVPGRNKTTSMMEAKYETLSTLVKDALAQVPSVCLTADCWTESHSTTSFIGLTAHFPVDTELESVVLGVTALNEAHTIDYLAENIAQVIAKWGIDRKNVSLAVTDNADNIKGAVKKVFGNDRHFGCFDHTLNLIPKAALGYKKKDGKDVPSVAGVPELINRVKKIVAFSHKSYNFANELKRIQLERGNTEGTVLRLLQDVPTRWGSTFLMLQRFIEMREILTIASLKFTEVEMLSGSEFATLRLIRDVLKPLHLVTTEMSAEKSTTASKVIPMVSLLRKQLEKLAIPTTDDLAFRFHQFICSEFERRFGMIEEIMPLTIATLLDPRFQRSYSQNIVAVSRARTLIEDMLKKDIRSSTDTAEAALPTRAPASANPDQDGGDESLWESHDDMVARAAVAHSSDDVGGMARTELRAFLDRPPEPRKANPLEVWERIKMEYPHLYKIARVFLSMVATSVPSERMFSDTGNIMTDRGNRLSADHLQQRLFLSKVSNNIWHAFSSHKKRV